MYVLKQIPEDFVVKENSNVKIEPSGQYLYFKLKKKNINTLEAVKKIAQALGVKEKQIGFAGSKDKKAVTEQVCSVLGVGKEKLTRLQLSGIELEIFGYGKVPISLGDLSGNEFKIVIRNLEDEKIEKAAYFPNYFDEQRFSKDNAAIGKSLLKKDFSAAAKLISIDSCQEHLRQSKHDFVGAIRTVSKRLLRMYINSYQSFLWNRMLSEYLRQKGKISKEEEYSQGKLVFVSDEKKFVGLKVPLIGFGGEDLEKDEIMGEIVEKVMDEEEISYFDFVIKEIPELSLEGELRTAVAEIKKLKVGKKEEDDLNHGKKKVKVSFMLGKGSYATMALRRMMKVAA